MRINAGHLFDHPDKKAEDNLRSAAGKNPAISESWRDAQRRTSGDQPFPEVKGALEVGRLHIRKLVQTAE